MFRNIEVKMIWNWLLYSILIIPLSFAVAQNFNVAMLEGKIHIFKI